MKCPRCGLEEDRDKIPILWALKLSGRYEEETS
jgi:transposase